jgi:hypothetical protein
MEVLAITQVFERRVINQYALHSRVPDLRVEVAETIERIMQDEKWHLEWVGKALKQMESEYGADRVKAALTRYTLADREVYQKTMAEHEDRIKDLMSFKKR